MHKKLTKSAQKAAQADEKLRDVKKKFSQASLGRRTILYNSIPSMPAEFDTVIKTFGTIRNASATISASSFIHTNSLLHDTDDFSSSASNPLANIARNYSKYRVVGYSAKFTFSPRATQDVNMAVIHTANNPSYSTAISWSPGACTIEKSNYFLVPASTKSPCIVHGKRGFGILAVLGQEEFEQDDKYQGTISTSGVPTSPTDRTFLVFYSGLVTGTFAAGEVPHISVMLTQYVRFYDRYQ